MTTANDLLKGGGPPALKFDNIGDSYTGVLTSFEATQQTDFTSGEPKTFANGDPMWQIVLTLQTTLRDPAVEDDDGARRFYAKGAGLTALRQAVHATGAKEFENGAGLVITHNAVGTASKPGLNPPKLFAITYTRPANVALGAPPAAPAPVAAAPVVDVAALQAELEALKAAAPAQ